MRKALYLFCFSLLLTFHAGAQPDAKLESQRLMTLFHQLEGTFQVQVVNSRDKTELPLYIMDTIIAKRHQSEVVYFPLKKNVRIMILPYSVINKKGFVPVERTANVFEK